MLTPLQPMPYEYDKLDDDYLADFILPDVRVIHTFIRDLTKVAHSSCQQELWSLLDVAYSFIDYNLQFECPREVTLRQCKVPVDVSSVSMFIPSDLYLAPPFYDPFAYDVACLGNLFRCTFSVCSPRSVCLFVTEIPFQELVPRFPLLAPLVDKMTTAVVS